MSEALQELEEMENSEQEVESLFPEDFDMLLDEEDEDDEDEAVEYQWGLAFEKDFIKDGQNRLQACSGIEAWRQWCINCLSFDRNSNSPIYSSDFGIDTDEVFDADSREEAENLLSTGIIEALEADPYERTEHIEGIDFTWGVDSVSANIEVVGVDEATIDVQVTIER